MISEKQIVHFCEDCDVLYHKRCAHCGGENKKGLSLIELSLLRELRQQLKKVYGHLVIKKPQTEYEMGRSEMAKNIIRDLDELLCVEGEK